MTEKLFSKFVLVLYFFVLTVFIFPYYYLADLIVWYGPRGSTKRLKS